MKKLLIGSVSLIALASVSVMGAANAADYGMSTVASDGTYDWSGWYWGLKGGYGGGDARHTGVATTGDYSIDGFLFGTMSSYNFQSGNVVFGLDADSAFSGIDGTTSAANAACGSCTTDVNWVSTVRGRVGIAMDRVLPFVTAGVAFGEVEATRPIVGGGTDDDILVGYAVGAGLEWAFADGWHARIEYQYVDLGGTTMNFAGGPVRIDVDELHLVRVGVSTELSRIYKNIFQGS